MKKLFYLTITLIIFQGCQKSYNQPNLRGKRDVLADNVDTTESPADDFFQWANGRWFKENPIPETESSWGIGKKAEEEAFQRILRLCVKASKGDMAHGTLEQKIGDLWATGMDTIAIENLKFEPIKDELNQISDIKNTIDLFEMIGQMHSNDMRPVFYRYVYQDRKQSDKYAFYLMQGGLVLPEREYYFSEDANRLNIRKEYVNYISKILVLLGENQNSANYFAQEILKIETFLAEKHQRLENWRDPYKTYNKFSVKDLEKFTPSVAWHLIFEKMGLPVDSVIVGQPEFVKQVELAINKFPIDTWKRYLKFYYVSFLAPYLHSDVRNAHFDFFGKTIEGKKAPTQRWKSILAEEERFLGEALGQLFVKDYFSSKAKKRYGDMFERIRESFAEEIYELDWMSAQTKARSIEKLSGMKKKVGYPDRWKVFNSMIINRKSFVRNILNAQKWWFGYKITKLSKPADRNEWGITPHEYNAYYRPPNNEVVISASVVLIPGYKDEEIDDAVAYGNAGASTIGHEMTHGFDIGGRQYDVNGNLKQWWVPEDSARYVAKTVPLIDMYNNEVVVDTFRCRGEATLDENIADLGGVVLALRAFKKTEQFKQGKKIAGYTPLQRFFMAYALAWMNQYTKESLIQKVLTDEHAPPKIRINCVLSNIPEFYEAFNIKPGDKMYRDPSKRIKIW